MSTLAMCRMEVQFRLRDYDSANQSFDTPEIDQRVRTLYVMRGPDLPQARQTLASNVTISAGASTFTITMTKGTGSATYSDASELSLQRVSDGGYLVKVTKEQMDQFRNGQMSLPTGRPFIFTLYEDLSGVLQGQCYPAATSAEALNVFKSIGVDVPFSATNLDSAAVVLTDPARMGISAIVAAQLLPMIPDDELLKRRINPKGVGALAKMWEEDGERALYHEAMRRHAVGDTGRVERWVS